MGNYWIERYDETKFFGLYDGGELVAVCTYKRGAQEVKKRLEELEARIQDLEEQKESE